MNIAVTYDNTKPNSNEIMQVYMFAKFLSARILHEFYWWLMEGYFHVHQVCPQMVWNHNHDAIKIHTIAIITS